MQFRLGSRPCVSDVVNTCRCCTCSDFLVGAACAQFHQQLADVMTARIAQLNDTAFNGDSQRDVTDDSDTVSEARDG